MSDRIAVMHGGTIVGAIDGNGRATQEAILGLALEHVPTGSWRWRHDGHRRRVFASTGGSG